jgi:hypothetical protein
MIKFKALILLLLSSTVMANYTHPSVGRLLQSNNEPEGVVFELIERGKNTWEWAAPMIKDLRMQLKEITMIGERVLLQLILTKIM